MFLQIHTHASINTYTHTYICIYMYIYIYMYISINICLENMHTIFNLSASGPQSRRKRDFRDVASNV